jgi:hypothetical protein
VNSVFLPVVQGINVTHNLSVCDLKLTLTLHAIL